MVNKKTHKKKRREKYNGRKTKGGKAIDSGSYGCVFNPPLKCEGDAYAYNPKNITKLMYKKDTQSEIEEMAKVKKIIEHIPNKENYFLISNTSVCNPAELDSADLIDFDKECKLFTKRGIDSTNVNNKLHHLALLTMPNGGLNIERYVLNLLHLPEKELYRKFIGVNTALIKLLVNGIVPLNNMRFNHNDIKAGNILMSEDGHARLIDWGLSGENDGIHIPETIQDRSIAFNMPFSDIFFDDFVKKWLPEAFKAIKSSSQFHDKHSGQSELLKIVAVNMINKSIEKTSEGHYDYIMNTILHDIYKIYAIKNMYNRVDYDVLSNNVLIDYVHAVLLTYVDENGHFNDTKYFYEVFTKNVDIWGFLLAYVPIIEFGAGKFHIDVINAVCRILLKYCFSAEFAVKPIIINDLVLDLQSLNDIQTVLSANKMGTNKMGANKMGANKMGTNKISANKISANKISIKKHNISL
jgi:serine/threonine protein kinase